MTATTQPQALMSDLSVVMDDIVRIVEQETALVRAGSLTEASRLEPQKTELANRYYAGTARIKEMPPMSIFSMISSSDAPDLTVSSKG